jgi:hypothetical protein
MGAMHDSTTLPKQKAINAALDFTKTIVLMALV